MNTLSVVIPALNEEDGIANIIERVLAVREPLREVGVTDLELIVVDDGSRDRTAEIVASYADAVLVQHPVNRGYGAAIKTGFRRAKGNLLAFLDADGTYPPEYFPQLCRPILEEGADLVIGSRMAGAQSDIFFIQKRGEVMRVRSREIKRNKSGSFFRIDRAIYGDSRYFLKLFQGEFRKFPLVFFYIFHTDFF